MNTQQAQEFSEAMRLYSNYRIILEVSTFIVAVDKRNGLIAPHKIGVLEGYRIPLLHLISKKNVLSPLASSTLTALNHAIDFVKTRDTSARKAMIAEYKKGDQIAIKLRKEGVFNGE